MQRYKLTIEYDGTGLVGWQRQENGQSVQAILEAALYDYCQESILTYASGRTDAGVHARGQVVHCDLPSNRSAYSVMHGLNHHLDGKPVVVLSAETVSQDFHARFSAVKRHYRYLIVNRSAPLCLQKKRCWHVKAPLNIEQMQQAADLLTGHHDFSSFRAAECQAKSPVKTIESIHIAKRGDNVMITVSAPSFLHHMIRNIAGTLVDVGKGKTTADGIPQILAAKNRCAAGPTAPAWGLYFIKVDY